MKRRSVAPVARPAPKVIASLDFDVLVRFGRNASGFRLTSTDSLTGKKETIAEIVPRGRKPRKEP